MFISKLNSTKSTSKETNPLLKSNYTSIRGNHTFFADLSVVGNSPFQSCNLVANAYTKSDKNYSLPATFKWFRVRSSRTYELTGVNANTFQLSAADIGSMIKVEISSIEEDYIGTAICEFGPVMIDSNLKRNLEALLVNGGTKFIVDIQNEKENKTLSAELILSGEILTLLESERLFEFKIPYSLEQPQIDINSRDATKIALIFHPLNLQPDTRIALAEFCGSVNRINLIFKSRYNRDLACLSIKSLAIKSYLVHSKSISSSIDLFTERKFREDNFLETLIEIESLKKEVNFLVEFSNSLMKNNEKLSMEVKDIEDELNTTIETFNKLFSELKFAQQNSSAKFGIRNENDPFADLSKISNRADYDARKKCKALETEKRQLQKRIDELEGKNAGFFNESMIWVQGGEEGVSMISGVSIPFISPILNLTKKESERPDFNINEDMHAQKRNEELSNKIQELKAKNEAFLKQRDEAIDNNSKLNQELSKANKLLEQYNEGSVMRSQSQSFLNESGYRSIVEFHDEIYNENLSRMERILNERKIQIEELKKEVSRLTRSKDSLLKENEDLKSKFGILKFTSKNVDFSLVSEFDNRKMKETEFDLAETRKEKETLQNEVISLRTELRLLRDNSDSFLHQDYKGGSFNGFGKENESQIFHLEKENEDLRGKISSLETLLETQGRTKNNEIVELKEKLNLMIREAEINKRGMEQDYSILSGGSSKLTIEAEIVYLRGKIKALEKANESIALDRDKLLVQVSKRSNYI